MGILNVTPDSFSDGRRFASAADAIAAGRALMRAGADILDIGGESTRPNAKPISPDEEMGRILPVIEALAKDGAVISADTRNAATMLAALESGARIINDVSGLRHDAAAAVVVAGQKCPVVLMHMRGSPMTMNCQAHYANLVRDVLGELAGIRDSALAAGILPEAIVLDPGFGFAKIGGQNIELLRALKGFSTLGHPLLVGVSRKSFVGAASGEPDADRRLPGSLAAAIFAVTQGASILRVHDVGETVQALKMWRALTGAAAGSAKEL